jgi:hypothetical protein
MQVLGRTVEMVGVSCTDLELLGVPRYEICRDIFAHNCYYSSGRLCEDVPEFKPRISLEEGIRRVFDSLQEQRIPPSEPGGWEDEIIERVERMRGRQS